jgi:Protein of unknown function (DUF3987)/Bifunctional DNA primase/polymerase, N-terminal
MAAPAANLVTMQGGLQEAALGYASDGWAVFPVRAQGKEPLTRHGFKEASTDVATIRSWWRRWPDANIGLPIPKGLVVVDIDTEEAFQQLKSEDRHLPSTVTARTARGWHFWYSTDSPARPKVKVLPGVDIRGIDSYVVVPPSIHPSGAIYRWEIELHPGRIAPAPAWLLKLLRGAVTSPPAARGPVDTAKILAGVPEGQRDFELFRLASNLRRVDVPQAWAERLILESAANCTPPFPECEARAKVKSAYDRYRPDGAFVSSVSSLPGPFRDLRSLPSPLPEAPELPPELLPTPFRGWLEDIADRMQVPLELVTVPALVAASAVVGRTVGIHPKAKDDWLVVPNLWGGIIALPGWLKSPTLAEALRPIRRLAEEARKTFEQRQEDEGARVDSLKAKEAAIKDQLKQAHKGKAKEHTAEELEQHLRELRQELKELASRHETRYIVNDTTTEKLGELLAENPMGLLLERDELAGWLQMLDREDRKGDREFYLESWNGTNSYTYDRIGRGTIHIPALCLSIVGGIQPAKFNKYISGALAGGSAADGLLQRFQLLVWPESARTFQLIDRDPNIHARQRAFAVFERLDRCGYDVPRSEGEDILGFRFDEQAQQLFYSWLNELEHRVRTREAEEHPAFTSHLAKYRSLMPSLALLFHLIEIVESGGPVPLRAAQMAANWCDFLEQHAQKIYGAELQPHLTTAHSLAAKIRSGAVYDGMTVREAYRPGWSHLKSAEDVCAAAQVLEQHGWTQIVTTETGGRSSQVIRLNPALKDGAP